MANVTVDVMGRIPMSPSLAATLGRAHQHAHAYADSEVTLEHLLLALVDDPDAIGVLEMSGVDLSALSSDVSSHLGRNQDRKVPGGAASTMLSEDAKRILEAAAAAAKGRRREIDGAIVVAAIVGDGSSTAAHILRARGLTFEDAIRALQQYAARKGEAAAGAASAGPPRQPPTGSGTDGILASARQRVATRAATGPTVPRAEPKPAARKVPATGPVDTPGHQAEADGDESSIVTPAPHERPSSADAPAPGPAARAIDDAKAPPEPAHGGPDDAFAPDWSPAVVPAPPLPGKITVPGALAPPPAPRQPEPPPMRPHPGAHAPASAPFESVPGRAPVEPFREPPDGAAVREGWAPPPVAERPATPPPIPQRAPPPMPPDLPARPQARAPARMPPSAPYRQAPQAQPAPPPAAAPVDSSNQLRPPPSAPARPRPAAAERARPADRLQPGQIAENIPRVMQVAVPRLVEVRIGKSDAKALAEGLQGSGTVWQHDVMISKAMSVRLRAPEGGFFIETASPETQWIENHLGGPFADDFASWRWTITPKARGKRRLLLVVSVRTVGSDGLAAETALPDQVFEIKVRTNYGLAARRWIGWVVAAVAGGLLARFGDGLFEAIANAIKVLVK